MTNDYDAQRALTLPALPGPEQYLVGEHLDQHYLQLQQGLLQAAQAMARLFASSPSILSVLTAPGAPEQLADGFGERLASAWRSYWQRRAAGSTHSREMLAAVLQRQHLLASAAVLAADADADAELQRLFTAIAQLDDNVHLLQWESVHWPDAADGDGAVVLCLTSAVEGAQLLYTPAPINSLATFDTRAALQQHLQGAPLAGYFDDGLVLATRRNISAQLAAAQRDFDTQVLPALGQHRSDGLAMALRLAQTRNEPAGQPQGGSPAPLHAVEQLLKACDDPHAEWAALNGHQQALLTARLQARVAATSLVATPSARAGQVAFDAMLVARLTAWRAELRLHKALGYLSGDEHALLAALLDQPRDREGLVAAHLQARYAGQLESLPGVLLVAAPVALATPPQPGRVFLFWPGEHGALYVFDSLAGVRAMLCGSAATAQDLVLEEVRGHAFEQGLVAQLDRYQADIVAVTAGSRRFEDAATLEQSLERLRLEGIDDLVMALATTRDEALAKAAAQALALQLSRAPVTWSLRLDARQRDETQRRIAALCEAIHVSHRYLAGVLTDRTVFVERLLDIRLCDDFDMSVAPDVELDLPLSVSWVTDIVAGSGAPGTPKRKIPKASTERVSMSLAELALAGVDSEMNERLLFARIQVTPQLSGEGIGIAYLKKLVEELDVAQAYEDHLWAVYRGLQHDTTAELAARREALITPFTRQLQLQALLAYFSQRLSRKAWQIVNRVISASTAEQYRPDGWAIICYPLTLHAPDTAGGSGFTLGGISVIHEQRSSITVLHLPDAPNHLVFSEYDSLEAARLALVDMALQSKMVAYLGSRAWTGNAALHASYINQAMLQGFKGFISLGVALAPTLSLAERQTDQQMGRLIQAHRASSRSQRDLFFQAALMEQGNVFNYIKMALGIVPFVGVGVGLYDAWTAANAATRAFLKGDVVEGLDQLEQILLAVIDAGMDVAPSLPVFRPRGPASNWPGASVSSQSIFVRNVATPHRFTGYEAAIPIHDLQPGRTGRMRGVYQVGDQHVIGHHGMTYPVLWDATYATWRLRGGPQRSYQQPVALDSKGYWQVHGAIDGALVRGGLAGGGAMIGRMAQYGWTGLSGYVRRRLRGAETDLQRRARSLRELQSHLDAQHGVQRPVAEAVAQAKSRPTDPAVRRQLEKALADNRDYNRRALELMEAVGTEGINRVFAKDVFASAMHNTMKRSRELEGIHLSDLQRAAGSIQSRTPLSPTATAQELADYVRQAMADNAAVVGAFERTLAHRLYQERLFERYQGSHLLPETMRKELQGQLDGSTSSLGYRVARSTPLSAMSRNPVVGDDVFLGHFDTLRERLKKAAINLFELKSGQVNLSNTQRRRIVGEVFEDLRHAKVLAVLLESRFRQKLNLEYWPLLSAELDWFLQEAGELLADIQRHAARQPAGTAKRAGGASQKRVFETSDDQLLIGTQRQASDGAQLIEITEPETGRVLDAYRQGQDGRWTTSRVAPPQGPTTSLQSLMVKASEGLAAVDNLIRKVQGYSAGSMDATSLEDILHLQAREFGKLADDLDQFGGPTEVATLSSRLRGQAGLLFAEGTKLRIAKLKGSLPTAAAVVFLHQRGQVRIEKLGARLDIRNRHGKIVDYLQEYQVVDALTGRALWFAHFHFQKAATPFQNFLAGHLKTAEQRHLGLQWQMAQQVHFEEVTPIYRGRIPVSIGMSHFAGV